jgi:hypothetical protein
MRDKLGECFRRSSIRSERIERRTKCIRSPRRAVASTVAAYPFVAWEAEQCNARRDTVAKRATQEVSHSWIVRRSLALPRSGGRETRHAVEHVRNAVPAAAMPKAALRVALLPVALLPVASLPDTSLPDTSLPVEADANHGSSSTRA